MAASRNQPVIFLAFANEKDPRTRERYLRSLGEEVRTLRRILREAQKNGLCELVERTDADIQDIFDVFTDEEYRDRVAVFHYGGHANSCQLLLESQGQVSRAADALGLAEFIGLQNDLSLVFLNACSTEGQARGFLDAGVSNVIATERRIPDALATVFAGHFYTGLASGASIRQAFDEASAKCRTEDGGAVVGEESGEYAHREDQELADATSLPWNLFTREGHESVCEWNLPDAVSNPLFGLPEVPERPLPDSPFRHLGRFEEEHAEVFFGRGYEIRDIYRLVTDPHSAPIVLYCGQTGVGKSSLLAAGLMPRLKAVQDVEYCRRSRNLGLTATFLEALGAPDCQDGDAILAAWKQREAEAGKPLTVIVDQVEEVFTRGTEQQGRELDAFLDLLGPVFAQGGEGPGGKLLLSFRKEWALDIERRLHERKLFHVVRYLERLNKRGIIDAIEGPTRTERLQQHFQLTVAPELAVEIVDDLLRDEDSPIGPTLEILLRKMWDATGSPPRTFTRELYRQQETRLDDFLGRQLKTIGKEHAAAIQSGLVLDILTAHTTHKGTAEACTRETLERVYGHVGDDLDKVMGSLAEAYLLFQTFEKDPADPNGPQIHQTRLAHDTLAPLIRARFDSSGLPGQRARHILENRAPEWEDGQTGPRLDSTDLGIVLAGESGMRALTQAEQRLVASSRKRRSLIRLAVLAVGLALSYAAFSMYQAEKVRAELLEKEQAQSQRIRTAGILSQAEVAESPVVAALLVASLEDDQVTSQGVRVAMDVAQQKIPFDILTGHAKGIGSLACSHDDRYVFSGGWDFSTRKWDLVTGAGIWQGRGDECLVEKIVLNADSSRVATVYKTHVVISTPAEGSESTLVAVHDDWITGAAFSRRNPHLLTAAEDGSVRLWNVSGGLDQAIEHCEAASDDTRAGALASRLFEGAAALDADYSADGKLVAVALDDGTVRLLQADNLAPVATLEHAGLAGASGASEIVRAKFSPRNPDQPGQNHLLSATAEGELYLWDLRELLSTWQPGGAAFDGTLPAPLALEPHASEVLEVLWSKRGRFALTLSEEQARLWRASDLSGPEREKPAHAVLRDHTGERVILVSARFSSDEGHAVTVSDDASVSVWSLDKYATGGPLGMALQLTEQGEGMGDVAFCYDDNHIVTASAGDDGELRLWDIRPNEPLEIVTGESHALDAKFTPDGNYIVTAFEDHPAQLWYADGSGLARDLQVVARSVDVGPDSDYVLAVTGVSVADPQATCADGEACEPVIHWSEVTKFPLPDGDPFNVAQHEEHPMGEFDKVIAGPSGSEFLTTRQEGYAKRWGARGTPPRVLSHLGKNVFHADFHPRDGRILTATGDNTAILGAIAAGDSDPIVFADHAGWLEMAEFSDDGRLIATASDDNQVRVFLADQPETPPVVFAGHTARVKSVDFSSDGQWLVSASNDGEARVWSVSNPKEYVILRADGRPVQHAEFSPDDQRVLTASYGGAVRVWRYRWPDLLAYLKAATRVCLGVEDRVRYFKEDAGNGDGPSEAQQAYEQCLAQRAETASD